MKFLKLIVITLIFYMASFSAVYWHCHSPKGWEYSSVRALDLATFRFYWPIYVIGRNVDVVLPHWLDPVYDYSRMQYQ